MKKLLILAALFGAQAFGQCASGFISIVDSFQLPNGQSWTGSIVYTLAYNTTISGATIVNARQQFNVTNGINICLAPGIYAPVTLNQSGFGYGLTTQWSVPSTGGPYTIAQISGAVTLSAGVLSVGATSPYVTSTGGVNPVIAAVASATGGNTNLMARDANGNSALNNISIGNNGSACAGTVTMTVASAGYQTTSSGSGTITLVLPNATTLPNGLAYLLNNNCSGVLTVQQSGTGTTFFTIPPGGFQWVGLTSNSFQAGQWDHHVWGPSPVQWGTYGLQITTIFSAAGTPIVACSSAYLDNIAQVSDANSPTWNGVYASGGSTPAIVLCDGTNWRTR